MRTFALLALLLVACGDNESPCEGRDGTKYLGRVVDCWGVPGICVREREGTEIECRPLCEEKGNPCEGNDWPETIAVRLGPPVCYCEPPPCHHSGTCDEN